MICRTLLLTGSQQHPYEQSLPRKWLALLPWLPPPEAGVQFRPGCVAHAGRPLLPELAHTVRVLPDDLFDGFFVAVLRKRDDAPSPGTAVPEARQRRAQRQGRRRS